MRIGDFAAAARTTARTVRHYHSLGLLPEPARRANGYRDYELADLIAVMRIGWLARSGVPLGRIGEILAAESTEDTDRVRRDLGVVIDTLAAERDRLEQQLAALREVEAALSAGRRLTALPADLDAALTQMADASEGEHDLVEREREMLEVMALSGDLPPVMIDGYRQLAADPVRLKVALGVLAEFAALEGMCVGDCAARIDALAERLAAEPVVVEMLTGTEHLATLPEDAAFFLPDPAQREVVRRLLERLS